MISFMESGLLILTLKVLFVFFFWQVAELMPNISGQVRFNFKYC